MNDEEWRALREGFEQEARTWLNGLDAPRTWDEVTLSGFVSSVAHTAYHMGAIRQLVPAAGATAKV